MSVLFIYTSKGNCGTKLGNGKFDLIIIGAHNGSGLEELILKQKNRVLLIEPVNYNLQSLKNRFKDLSNIIFENVGVSDEKKN